MNNGIQVKKIQKAECSLPMHVTYLLYVVAYGFY